MRVLIACEYSGTVRDAFIAAGHWAMSCDLLPTEREGPHHQGDVFEVIDENWDLMIAHPPCTYLASSGMHRTIRGLRDPQLTEDALEFVSKLLSANIEKIALENPVGCISSRIRKPDQYVHPYFFGHDASKRTGLWLKNLPLLVPTNTIDGRIVAPNYEGGALLRRWANQTDSGQNKLPPSEDRWKLCSTTYQGLADAMAKQWSIL